jgi:phospholysine phosphohistidine inorganic pyrophosphate phosphatase
MTVMLFDLDGVLYQGEHAIDGAAETVRWFADHRIPHLFLTNTTSKPRLALVEKLAGYGIKTSADDFLTPPVAATAWLREQGINDVALFVPDVLLPEFSDFTRLSNETDKVQAVIIGDLGESWTFETLNVIFRMLMNNSDAQLVALGMTRYWRTGKGLQLDVGPMVRALEYATGKNATVTGKPDERFFHAAMNMLGDSSAVMIGDDIRGDVEAAQHAGVKGLLVKTGKYTNADLASGITPDAVLDSIADLPHWWQRNT